MVTLVDELLLLAYDDESGRTRVGHLEHGLAGAVLLELALAERITLDGGKVVLTQSAPTGSPLVDEAMQALAADKPRKPKALVERLSRGLKQKALGSASGTGLLRPEEGKALGLFPFKRYLPGDPGAEVDARARLASAVELGRASDARTAGLASLVYALGMERVVFPDRPRGATRKALKAISEGSWAGAATKAAVEAAQAAVMAAIMASTAAAGASGGGGS